MKKNKFTLVFVLVFSLFWFFACSKEPEIKEFYIDDEINIDNISISIECSESGSQSLTENKRLHILLECTNQDIEEKNLNFSNCKIKNKDTGVGYAVIHTGFLGNNISLPYDIETMVSFEATIPTSIKYNHYVFSFGKNEENVIHLMEKPDSLRQDCSVSYQIDGKVVRTESVKFGRSPEGFKWESNEGLYYCNKWYTTEDYVQIVDSKTNIKQDTIIYGKKERSLDIRTDINAVYIDGINNVPSNGVLVVSDYGLRNQLYLSNFGIYNNNDVREVYLPKSLSKIFYGNFTKMNSLTKIHYAGTQLEWESINGVSTLNLADGVQVVFNSFYSN